MAIFGKIKKAFGLQETEFDDEEALDLPSASVTPLAKRSLAAQAASETSESNVKPDMKSKAVNELPQYPSPAPETIFGSVVELFNENLPDFIKQSVDRDKQTALIYQRLDESTKEYISQLESIAQQRTEAQWATERQRLKSEMDTLQTRSKQVEDSNAEWKEQKLSAERQKRALSERVHDLEKMIATFEAEREQFELENKSLVNKLRAATILEDDLQSLQKDNEALRNQVNKLQSTDSTTLPDTELTNKLEATIQEKDKEISSLKEELIKIEKQAEQMSNDISVLKKKTEIADAMINDLNQRASTAQKSVTEREAEILTLTSELDSLRNAGQSVGSNDRVVKELEAEKSQLKSELDSAMETISSFDETLDQFENIKLAKDKQIAQLQENIKQKDAEINDATKEIASLKSTIENNLKLQAESEQMLREEIESMRKNEVTKPKRSKRKPKITSIDESLDDTDWLIATPPEGTNARPTVISDSEFGYQEPPKRKESPSDNSPQMSLW